MRKVLDEPKKQQTKIEKKMGIDNTSDNIEFI